MGAAFEINTKGFSELAAVLKEMPDKVMAQRVRKSEYEACKIVRDDARNKAPMHAGPYPVTRGKGLSAKGLARALARAEKHGVTAEDVREKAAGMSGRQKGNRDRQPGLLKKSIIIGQVNGKQSKDLVVMSIGLMKRAFYGRYIEMGFVHAGKQKQTHVPARPFLRPAFDQNIERVLSKFADGLREYVAGWKNA